MAAAATSEPDFSMLPPSQFDILKEIISEWNQQVVGPSTNTEVEIEEDVYWLYDMFNVSKPKIVFVDSIMEYWLLSRYGFDVIAGMIADRFDKLIDYKISRLASSNIISKDIHQLITILIGSTLDDRLRMFHASCRGIPLRDIAMQIQQREGMSVDEYMMRKFHHAVAVRKSAFTGSGSQPSPSLEIPGRGVVNHANAAYFEFLTRTRIESSSSLSRYCSFMKKTWAINFTNPLVTICRAPAKLRMDRQGVLHSADEEAIRWRDGTKSHFLHGVYFPEALWRQVTTGSLGKLCCD